MPKSTQTGERLQKYLAGLGVGSRRTIEGWIEQGKIRVNGRIAQLGDKVNPNSRITVDGRPIRSKPSTKNQRVILYNKPEGEISTRDDPADRPTIFRHLPRLKGERWVSIGRLDINTRGLMLFTNDGQLANRLMHPRFGIEREYLCRVYGQVDPDAMTRLQQGIMLDGKSICFQQLKRQRGEHSNTWYSVVVNEGKFREIRRMWEAVGCKLSRLIRVRYGNVSLPKTLKQGQWQELKPAEIYRLTHGEQAATGTISKNRKSKDQPPLANRHGPSNRGPSKHGPANHGPAKHGPAKHGPAKSANKSRARKRAK